MVSTTIKIQHEEKIDNKKKIESSALMKIKKLIAISLVQHYYHMAASTHVRPCLGTRPCCAFAKKNDFFLLWIYFLGIFESRTDIKNKF